MAGEVDSWEDVERAEPVLQVPVRLLRREESYSTMMIGLSPDSELYGLYSTSGEGVAVSDRGILLGSALRNTLEGLVRLAQEHVNDDDHVTFVGPDGVALE